jgi:15-cis-phytoene synthase
MELYHDISFKTSKLITHRYSTSFSIAVSILPQKIRKSIYSIYGFVRLADEIVDTFNNSNRELLLKNFERDYFEAMENGISMNPVLHSFALTVRNHNIPLHLIESFLGSMKADLNKTR